MKPDAKRKIKRYAILALVGFATVIAISLAFDTYWQRKQPVFKNAPQLISALQAFAHDRVARNQPLPPSVSLPDLVAGGYLTTNDVRAFQGMEISFSTSADDTYPQSILAVARTPDGNEIVLLADGSVQQHAKRK